MEWRIIFAALCLIGILTVPGNATNDAASANSTAQVKEINITFSINDTFQAAYSDMSANETKSLSTNITTQFNPIFKTLPGYIKMIIRKFSNGSIVTDGGLQFNSSVNGPNMTDVKKVITDAIANGNLTFKIINGSINVTAPLTPEILSVPGNATNDAASANSTAQVKEINITFSINDTFQAAYSDMSANETKSLSTNITTQFNPIFKTLPGYIKMIIRKFSNGSIVTDGGLQFNSSVNGPNMTDVKKVITDAIANGNLTFKIINGSINVTAPLTPGILPVPGNATNVTASANSTAQVKEINITFSINDTFQAAYSDMSANETKSLSTNITTQLDQIFKNISCYKNMIIRKFSNGSIKTEGALQFISSVNCSDVPDVRKMIIAAIESGKLTFKIIRESIYVASVNSSPPVLSCMLTALWMTLASLLLTGVMQF